jgi:hypothetical protein
MQISFEDEHPSHNFQYDIELKLQGIEFAWSDCFLWDVNLIVVGIPCMGTSLPIHSSDNDCKLNQGI